MRELISTLKGGGAEALAGNDLSNILPKSSQARKKTPPDTLGFEHRYCLGNRRWKAALVWKNKQGVYNVQFYSHETILSAIRQPCGSESGDSPNREHYKYEGLTPFPAMRQRCGFFFFFFFYRTLERFLPLPRGDFIFFVLNFCRHCFRYHIALAPPVRNRTLNRKMTTR